MQDERRFLERSVFRGLHVPREEWLIDFDLSASFDCCWRSVPNGMTAVSGSASSDHDLLGAGSALLLLIGEGAHREKEPAMSKSMFVSAALILATPAIARPDAAV